MAWLSYMIAFAKNLNPFRAVKLEVENAQLQRDKIALEQQVSKLQQRDQIKYTEPGYIYVASGTIAYCATCYETKDQQLVSLVPAEQWNGGVRRVCPSCHREYWDQPANKNNASPRVYRNDWVKHGWME